MSVYETNHRVPLGSIITLRAVTLVESAVDAFLNWHNARETRRMLAKLSDAQLADIGVRRSNIGVFVEELARA